MNDDQTLLGNAGAKPAITHDGKDYRFSFTGPRIRSQFTEWLKAQARREICALRDAFSEEDFRLAMGEFVRQCASGDYGPGSRAWNDAIRTDAGFVEFVRLLLVADHPRITTDETRALVESHPREVELILSQISAVSVPKA